MQSVASLTVTATVHHAQLTLLTSASIATLYDSSRKVPLAVIEHLPDLEPKPRPCKRPSYRLDPRLPPDAQACDDDYKGTRWSRGHLARGPHHRISPSEYRTTYLFTNICPQDIKFNSGVWRCLEEEMWRRVRSVANAVLVSGPLYVDGRVVDIMGKGRVAVPTHYYKLLFSDSHPPQGWVLEHRRGYGNERLDKYQTDLSTIEALANLRFEHRRRD